MEIYDYNILSYNLSPHEEKCIDIILFKTCVFYSAQNRSYKYNTIQRISLSVAF